jgi:CDP-diacylglycerol---glycerol-3-phosphate 3-phosphatidyltransferase
VFDGRFREGMERGLRPVGTNLGGLGISADQLTAVGLGFAVATAVAIGSGHLLIGLFLLAASSIPDMLDGAVAKASGTASPRGAFFDSVCDRLSDALVLGGVAWHLAVTDGGLAPMLPMAVMAASMLISYERARAESLGFTARGGLMERAERIIMLGVALAFPVVLVPVLAMMLVLTAITAGQRFVMVWRQGSSARPRHEPSRWRTRMTATRRGPRSSQSHNRSTRWQGTERFRRARSRP